MPIDLCGSINKTSRWAFGSPILNSILGSSVFVAFVIAFTMVIIIMIMYPAKSGTSFGVVIKMFIYMLFGSMLVVFLHDGVIKAQYNEKNEEDSAVAFMRSATMGGRQYDPSYGSTYKQINPATGVAFAQGGADEDENEEPDRRGHDADQNRQNHAADQNRQNPSTQGESLSNNEVISIVEGGAVTGGRLQGPRPKINDRNPFN